MARQTGWDRALPTGSTVSRRGCMRSSPDLPGRSVQAISGRSQGFRMGSDPFGSSENGEGVRV